MEYSRQYLAELANKTNFIKDNLEKVLRLAEILKFLNNDKGLAGKLALKGGTAINLTAVELPRLSVDIDLDFTQNLSSNETAEEKNALVKRLINYMEQEGYSLTNTREHYALTSFVFNYLNNAGNRDNIKIEINLLNRCHILPLEHKQIMSSGIIEQYEILTLNTIELYASKINALLSRATPRDLYDIDAMIQKKIIDAYSDMNLLRKCLIFYNMLGGEQDIDEINYSKIEKIDYLKFKTQLKPVIAKTDTFDLNKAKRTVIDFLKQLIILTDNEKKFIIQFRNKNYCPETLFSEQNIICNIKSHPAALWRCKK